MKDSGSCTYPLASRTHLRV